MSDIKYSQKSTMRLCGTWNIGSKWQIVIPKDARDVMGLSPGDSVSFVVKDEKFLWVIPNTSIEELLAYIESEKNITLVS